MTNDRPAPPADSAPRGVARRSEGMLSELLALNEEMVEQFRLERQSVVGTTEFLTGMIDQHEQIVARLKAQLKRHEAGSLLGRSQARPASFRNPLTC